MSSTGRLEDAHDELEALLPKVFAANEAAASAERSAFRKQATDLKPQHAQAIERIAAALEQLSDALDAEARVRDQVRDRNGIIPDSLPDMSFGGIGNAMNHNSPISAWFRRARQAGYTE